MSDTRINAALAELTRQNTELRDQCVQKAADIAELQERIGILTETGTQLQHELDAARLIVEDEDLTLQSAE
ncbi:hypothetical protein V1T76_08515 [Roseibium sp. FZY0029]|uniref:hypothetical protein n=1 Tax=Roseibium sp. FZY0029 TaxID=3116647 RepID=UPI002EB6E32F|nr:hypothetical protein [Roseibium sp. FZY0029]